MMKATRIIMKNGCENSQNCVEIDKIYIEGCSAPGYYKKETVHDYVTEHPNSICVDGYPRSVLIPAFSQYNEKYVRSTPNDTVKDNLLELPRE